MEEIVKLREGIFNMQICASIPPEQKHVINAKLEELGLATSGTSHGWMLDESVEPVPCADYQGRWHYICIC